MINEIKRAKFGESQADKKDGKVTIVWRCVLYGTLIVLLSLYDCSVWANNNAATNVDGPFGKYVVSKNDEVNTHLCRDYARNLNQFRDLKFESCTQRFSPRYPRFKKADWKPYPFDLALAKRLVIGLGYAPQYGNVRKWQEIRWKKWLAITAGMRAKDIVKMWYTKVDMLGYGNLETIVRMNYARIDVDKPIDQQRCGKFYDAIVMLGTSETARKFSFNAGLYASDLLYDSVSKIYYATIWQHDDLDPVGARIGGKGMVIVSYYVSNPAGQTPIGLADICHIVWVPAKPHLSSRYLQSDGPQ